MEEVSFVRRNKQIPLASTAASVVAASAAPVAPSAPVNESVVVSDASTKQVVIQADNNKEKYSRTVPSDELRCTAIVRSGDRCKFLKVKDTEFCSRHPPS